MFSDSKQRVIRYIFALLLTCFLFISFERSYNVHVKRFASITGLKAEKLVYYKKLHAHAWPAVLRRIKDCNISNYSIYLKKIQDRYYLFSYFEYTGTDFKADMKKMADDPTTQRWWKETDPCQQPLPEAAANGKVWADMEEVFHTE
ncbi:L-rhamnose mutarotase [Mucilaginibacter sp. BJC16-A38]|uniref:L-rhamnose mutarotase n=1 Tax=Mucilaginibacter phenanthrenivorans TaxID=1234842 RepID=UPI0021584823|nr:L-rhamnose mutarotase [Mucilaginibacter phenanthrenivorans]MCR8559548.1 L-rhamnose mutarotase [Mucilaginibacter phenanthrenivorans]